jgi:hypothetical protein
MKVRIWFLPGVSWAWGAILRFQHHPDKNKNQWSNWKGKASFAGQEITDQIKGTTMIAGA